VTERCVVTPGPRCDEDRERTTCAVLTGKSGGCKRETGTGSCTYIPEKTASENAAACAAATVRKIHIDTCRGLIGPVQSDQTCSAKRVCQHTHTYMTCRS
jgi:hypothetical protein